MSFYYEKKKKWSEKDHCKHEKDICCDKPKRKDEAILVNKVICSKSVQKTAEFALPFAIGPLGATGVGGITPAALAGLLNTLFGITVAVEEILAGLVSVRVRPVFNEIESEITVVKDKIINLGFVPAFLEVRILGSAVPLLSLPIRIYFQEHTDCPGVCPGDTVTETPYVVEATLDQELIQIENGNLVLNLLLFKAILRTTITATRPTLVDPYDHDCVRDVNEHRCDPNETPRTINFPTGD
ncbi:hypothetical protein LG307_07145 [Sutcliffiella horikoshii]|uniref:hypothetical protein n=1 Tax=Sutcliffiella horikoshii TaxID=79883 RepID=UPI00384DD165